VSSIRAKVLQPTASEARSPDSASCDNLASPPALERSKGTAELESAVSRREAAPIFFAQKNAEKGFPRKITNHSVSGIETKSDTIFFSFPTQIRKVFLKNFSLRFSREIFFLSKKIGFVSFSTCRRLSGSKTGAAAVDAGTRRTLRSRRRSVRSGMQRKGGSMSNGQPITRERSFFKVFHLEVGRA
jgi:hypothetical protein